MFVAVEAPCFTIASVRMDGHWIVHIHGVPYNDRNIIIEISIQVRKTNSGEIIGTFRRLLCFQKLVGSDGQARGIDAASGAAERIAPESCDKIRSASGEIAGGNRGLR